MLARDANEHAFLIAMNLFMVVRILCWLKIEEFYVG